MYNVFTTLVGLPKLDNGIKINNVSLFSKKQKTSHYTVLRAPYRYKKGRYQIGFSRVRVNVSLELLIPLKSSLSKNSDSINHVLNILPVLTNIFSSGSTNTITLDKVRLLIPFRSNNFFKVINYKPRSV